MNKALYSHITVKIKNIMAAKTKRALYISIRWVLNFESLFCTSCFLLLP